MVSARRYPFRLPYSLITLAFASFVQSRGQTPIQNKSEGRLLARIALGLGKRLFHGLTPLQASHHTLPENDEKTLDLLPYVVDESPPI